MQDDELVFAQMAAYVARYGHTAEIQTLRDSLVFSDIGSWLEDTWDPSGSFWEDF